MIFDHAGGVVAIHQKEHEQIFPKPGWVEHDPAEIWARSQEVIKGALDKVGIPASDLAAVGITNQRETAVVWDKNTGKAVYNAIVWQDTRTDVYVNEFGKDGGQDRFRAKVGLPLATYFSGPKVKWMLDNVDGARAKAEAGDLLFGNIDTWCIWNLTGGTNGGVHVTDVTNACRTMLMNLETLDWDDEILGIMGIPKSMLPAIKASSEVYGTGVGDLAGIPIAGDLGDQQAALFGQTCFSAGEAKNTYGTGCFMLLNTGNKLGPVQERPAHDAGLQDRQPAGRVRPRGLDRHHRRPRPVAARQPGHDPVVRRGRGAGHDRRGQRRGLLRPGVQRPVRAVLEVGRPRRHRRAHPLRQQGPHRACGRSRRRRGRPARSSTR